MKHLSWLFLAICLISLLAVVAQIVGYQLYFLYDIKTAWAFGLFQLDRGLMMFAAILFAFLALAANFFDSSLKMSNRSK